jgi:heme exporter protein CcmD
MIDLGPHADFIVWSYVGVIVTVVALIVYVRWDAGRVAQKLRALDEAGVRRRSAGPAA